MWFLFANIFQKAVMVIFTPLFTRVMTTEEFSKYAVFQSWEALITVFATLNISNYATAKALVEYRDKKNDFITSAEFLTTIITALTYVVFSFLQTVLGLFNELPSWIVALMFMDIISVAFFSFWSQLERSEQKYKGLTIVSIFTGIISPLIAFLLIIFSEELNFYKGWSRIIGLVFADLFVAVYVLYTSLKKSKVLYNAKYWKFCITYCIPLIPHFLAMAFLQKVGQLFVDNYCGSDMSGIYALASSLAMFMMIFNDALTKTIVPWTYQKMADEKYDEINKPIILSLVIIAVLDIAMALVAPELVYIFADSSYASAIYAIPPLVGVCYFGFLYNTFSNIEYYYKETKLVSLASVVAGVVIILANLILVPQFGYIAAAYASLLSYIIYALMHYYFMNKTLKKHLNGKAVYDNVFILRLSILFVAVILIIPLLYQNTVIRWMAIVALMVALIIKRKRVIGFVNDVVLRGGKRNE